MPIVDLTRGIYTSSFLPDAQVILDMSLDKSLINHFGHSGRLNRKGLERVPIFLVYTFQSLTSVKLPNSCISVSVPDDKLYGEVPDYTGVPLEDWLHVRKLLGVHEHANLERLTELPDFSSDFSLPELDDSDELSDDTFTKDGSSGCCITISDLLGVYCSDDDPYLPLRIFLWVDKIMMYANNDKDNTAALLAQVILHELAHADMDVRRSHRKKNVMFTYRHPAYKFIEEAYANAASLKSCYSKLNATQQSFITDFVQNQGLGYSEGVKLYTERLCPMSWTWAKRRFDREIGQIIGKSLIGTKNKIWTKTLEWELHDLRINREDILKKTFAHVDEHVIKVLIRKFIS